MDTRSFYREPNDILICQETSIYEKLQEIPSEVELFSIEVSEVDPVNMHNYVVDQREVIFGNYVYLMHEADVESGSIDFVGFDKEGHVYIIEVKRKADSRNRQEVIAQVLKYLMDTSNLQRLFDNYEERIADPFCKNKIAADSTELQQAIKKAQANIKAHQINAFVVTEDAHDQLLATTSFVSFGDRNRKITAIEVRRMTINNQMYCFIRRFNKQGLCGSSGRAAIADLEKKMEAAPSLVKLLIKKWDDQWGVNPNSENVSELSLTNGKLVIAYYYTKDTKRYKGMIGRNSLVFWTDTDEFDPRRFPSDFKDWLNKLECRVIRGSKGTYYWLSLEALKDEKINDIFDRLSQIAEARD